MMKPFLAEHFVTKQEISLHGIAYSLIVLLAAAIPLSTTAAELISAIVVLIWLIDKNQLMRWQYYFSYPLTKPILCLIGISLVGMLYSAATWKGAFSSFHHILRLSYIPIFAYYIRQNETHKSFIMFAFVAAMLFTILCTFLKVYGHLPIGHRIYGNDVFKNHIVISYFMAITIFLAGVWLTAFKQYRLVLISIIGLALFHLIFLNTGRIGFVILYVCAGVFALHRYKFKGLVAIFLLLTLMMIMAYQISPIFHKRINEFTSELALFFQGHVSESIGNRLEFAINSLKLFLEQPWFGLGTGGFKAAYVAHFLGKATCNPHNQYLKIAVELGIVGLLSFCWMLYKQWQLTKQLTGTTLMLAQGILLSFVVGCFFNSWVDNFSECYFYCLMTAYFFNGSITCDPADRENPI